MTPRNEGVWHCDVCDTFGTGGADGHYRHYTREHYRPVVNPDGRESAPRHYGEA